MSVSLIALRCRTRRPLSPARRAASRCSRRSLGDALGVEPRYIGSGRALRETRFEEDLRDARGCLLEAGGQVDDALAAGDVPVLLAADCSISITTLPAALRNRPEVKVLWLDAHGDYNTPATTGSGYLGGMCLAGACGEWDAGFGDAAAAGAGGAGRGPRPRRRRARAARAKPGDGDRREHRRDARGGQERARRRAGLHPPRPRRDRPGALPRRCSRPPAGCIPTSSTTCSRPCSRTASSWASRSPPSRRPTPEQEQAAATATAMRVLEPLLDHLAGDAQSRK